MRFTLLISADEGYSYGRQVELAQAAEEAGFEAILRADHWLPLSGDLTRPVTDAWATLAGLARETSRLRLGTLVSPVTFRGPVEMAKIVATVDEMSAGRVELGLGAGWYDPEHVRLGLPYPPLAERFDLLEEQLAVIHGLWTQPTLDFEGRYYRLRQAILEPKPVQRPHPPIILGGYGKPRGLRLAAAFADEYDLDGVEPDGCAALFGRLDEACEAIGRDPRTIVRSVLATWPYDAGRATQLARVRAFAEAGVERIHLLAEGWLLDPRLIRRLAGVLLTVD